MRSTRRALILRCSGAAAASAAVALSTPAWAAPPLRIFRLPSEPLDQGLVRFAVQGGVSIGGYPVAGCVGRTHPVLGLMSPAEALRRLLPEGCGFTAIDRASFKVTGSLAATPRPGPPPPPPRPANVQELVVTAEKRIEPLLGSPFAVSAMSGDEVRRQGADSLSQVALQMVSVAETNLGPGRNKLFIRGLSDGAFTGRTQSTVGLYLDDIPITYNAPDPDLKLIDVERIEVLRGPQGTLYGSGSIGGIVRVVTQPPDVTRFTGEVSVEGMLNEHNDRSSGISAVVNVPLNHRLAVRAVAYRDELSGYLDNPRLGLEDVNKGRRSGVRLSALAQVTDAWRLQATYGHQAIDTADSQYVQAGAAPLSRDTRLAEPHDNDFTHFGATVVHAGAGADLRVSAAYIDHDVQTRYDATGAFGSGAVAPQAFDDSQSAELTVVEGVVASAGAGRLRWLAGVFGSLADEHDTAKLAPAGGGGGGRPVFARRDRLAEAAAFGELTYQLTPRLTATAGGRLFATRVKAQADGFSVAASGVAPLHAHLTDEGFAPKLRLSYAFAPDVVVYAQAQEGYRAGGFNLPAGIDGMPGENVPSYRPDRLISYEVGGELPLFERTVILRAAAFRAVWRRVQTDQFRPSGLPVTLNIGDGSNTGLEVEAVWRPDAHLQLRASVLIDEPQLTRVRDVFSARVDIGLPGVADKTGSADVTYRWRPFPWLEAEVAGQVAYVGRSFLTFDGAAADSMGDYAVGRLSAALAADDWRMQAYVDNVADARGNTFAFGNPFSQSRTGQRVPLRPRTFGLALSRRF
jgi:iron complex outermembrane receptor protein